MISSVTSKRSSPLDSYPRSLQDGAERFVGLIDGYPNYYHRDHHRIDVLLERGDGTRRLSEYYSLRSDETVTDFLRKAESNGYDCNVLAQWSPSRGTHYADSPLVAGFSRSVRTLCVRLAELLHR